MVSREEVHAAVDKAKELMLDCGLDVDATAEDLVEWFDTALPIPDITLGEVVLNPLLVVHELVEIDEMLKMGFALTKDVILKNPGKVDDAHLKAAEIEMRIAHSIGAIEHIKDRILDMESWCVDESLAECRRADYGRLLATTREYLSDLERKESRGPSIPPTKERGRS